MALSLIENIVTNDRLDNLDVVLESCKEDKLFCSNKNEIQGFISFINNLLKDKSKRTVALKILDSLLPQCLSDIIANNTIQWMNYCLSCFINGDDGGSVNALVCNLLCELICYSSKYPEVKKETALTVVPKVLDQVQRHFSSFREEDQLLFLKTLEVVLKYYGKTCGTQRRALESLIFSQIESSTLSEALARCYLHLSSTGGPGIAAENYKKLFIRQEKFLINSLHQLMNLLFAHINEAKDDYVMFELDGDFPTIPKVTESNILDKFKRLSVQFVNLSKFLLFLLVGETSFTKTILHEAIFGVICRGLAVNHDALIKSAALSETVALAILISQINVTCLEMLEALILSFSVHESSYTPLIARLIGHTLKWSLAQKWEYGLDKPYQNIRIKTYQCLETWLQIAGCRSYYCAIERYMDDIVESILTDIFVEPPLVGLIAPGKKLTGKAQKRQKAQQLSLSSRMSSSFLPDPASNRQLCLEALKVLSLLLRVSYTRMKPHHYQEIQKKLISLVIQLQNLNYDKFGLNDLPIPYSDEDCRLHLYSALFALCQYAPRVCPPPVNYAHCVFNNGLKDTSLKVSGFCAEALESSIKIFNAAFPSLNLVNNNYEDKPDVSSKGTEADIFDSTNEEIQDMRTDSEAAESFSEIPLFQRLCLDDNGSSKEETSFEEIMQEYIIEHNLENIATGIKDTQNEESQEDIGNYRVIITEPDDDNDESKSSRLQKKDDQSEETCVTIEVVEGEENGIEHPLIGKRQHVDEETVEVADDSSLHPFKKLRIADEAIKLNDAENELMNSFVDEIME